MRFHCLAALALVGLLKMQQLALAQERPLFPPQALIEAPTQQAALAVLGAGRPESSGFLLVDADEIVLPGEVRVRASSELPGTTHLVLLKLDREPPRNAKVLVAAKQIPSRATPILDARVPVTAHTAFMVLAKSRGRWFFAVREVKVGRPAGSQP